MKAWMEYTDEKDSDCLWLQAELGVFIFHFQLNCFFGEGSKVLITAVMQLPVAWHTYQPCSSSSGGAGSHPAPKSICLCMGS